jgi:hypothetical protein
MSHNKGEDNHPHLPDWHDNRKKPPTTSMKRRWWKRKPPWSWGIHDVAGGNRYIKISINRCLCLIRRGSQFLYLKELHLSLIQSIQLLPPLFVHQNRNIKFIIVSHKYEFWIVAIYCVEAFWSNNFRLVMWESNCKSTLSFID